MSGSPVAADIVSAEIRYPPESDGWKMVFIFLALYVISYLDRNVFSLLGEQIRQDMRLSDVQLSLLFGPAFAVAYAVGALPVGWAMDRFSRRAITWGGVNIWSLGTLACGLTGSFAQLFAARSIIGAGEAVVAPGAQSILSDMFAPERRTFPLSVYSTGAVLGMGLSFVIGGMLTGLIDPATMLSVPPLGEIRGWQAIFIIVGAPGLVVSLLVFLVPEPRRQMARVDPRRSGYGDYVRFVRTNARFFTNFFVGATLVSTIVNAVYSWTPIFFQRDHGWSVHQTGVWLGAIMIAGPVIGLPVHGFLADRMLRRGTRDAQIRYLMYALAAAAPLLVASYLVESALAAVPLLCLGLAALMANVPLLPAAMQHVIPGDMRSKAASVSLFVTSIGGITIGPMFVALMMRLLGGGGQVGFALAWCVGLVLPLAALHCWMMLRPLGLLAGTTSGCPEAGRPFDNR